MVFNYEVARRREERGLPRGGDDGEGWRTTAARGGGVLGRHGHGRERSRERVEKRGEVSGGRVRERESAE